MLCEAVLDNNKSANLEIDNQTEIFLQHVLVTLAKDHGGIMVGDMAQASHIVSMYHLHVTDSSHCETVFALVDRLQKTLGK